MPAEADSGGGSGASGGGGSSGSSCGGGSGGEHVGAQQQKGRGANAGSNHAQATEAVRRADVCDSREGTSS